MLACNLYLLQLPHSDWLPIHYARHVAPDIIALFRLANRRKYVLPSDVSMNSTTAIQELYHDDGNDTGDYHSNNNNIDKCCSERKGSSNNENNKYDDNDSKKQSLIGEYCTALQLPNY